MTRYDVFVIGSGPGGYRAAVLANLRGLTVGIAEKATWGGTCLNRGCVPKKTWHHSARLLSAQTAFAERGLSGTLTIDFAQAWSHQKKIVETVRENYTDYLKRLGVGVHVGTAHFTGSHQMQVGEDLIEARAFILATGSEPNIPAPYTLSPGRVLTTDDLFDAPPPPGKRIALIGSGVIGSEFAYILTRLGLDVQWFAESAPLAKSRFSAPALKLLHDALKAEGVSLQRGRATQAEPGEAGVTLHFADGRSSTVDWVLLGTGRRPHTASLGLETAGVACDARGFVKVNAHLQSSQPHIYAIGDVANDRMTANQALADAALVLANLITPGSRRHDRDAVPELVYSAIELGRIGINEDEAEDAEREPATGFAGFEVNPRALGQDEGEGFVRLLADMDNGELLGAEVVGAEAGELIHLMAQNFRDRDALARFSRMAYNHPARSEEVQNASETLAAKWGLSEAIFGP
jgi:dihydrolipoamide dehydrogenase